MNQDGGKWKVVRYSVKKPFTVLVAVVAVIVIGVVSLSNMSTDLLPELSLPYLVVVTSYPGASPERVESEVGAPMENALGTVSNVKNVYSVNSENYSLVELEFEDGTNMDSAMVKVSSAVEKTSASLPDACGTPSIMEISMNMVATMYLAVEKDGSSSYELSDYVTKTVEPALERVDGVASVSDIGMIEKTVQVELNASKISALNTKILEKTSSGLEDAKQKLDESEAQVNEGQTKLDEQEKAFGAQLSSGLFDQIDGQAETAASSMKEKIDTLNENLKTAEAAFDSLYAVTESAVTGAASDVQNAKNTAESKAEAAGEALADAQSAVQNTASAVKNDPQDAVKILQQESVRAELANALSELSDVYRSIDGSSLAMLMGAVSRLSAIVPEISGALDTMRALDTDGALADPVSSVEETLSSLSGEMDQVPQILNTLESSYAQLTQGQLDAALAFSSAASQLSSAQTQLAAARTQYETERETALKNANADALLTTSTLSQLIYAQNFSMPAGYIDDAKDASWLLRIGDEYESSGDIANALLCTIDGIGTVRLSDVADVTVIDNSGESYAKLNGEEAVVLSVYKGSAAGTNKVSRAVNTALSSLRGKDPGLHVVSLMDQGNYITLIINDILQSILIGAFLAIVILAFFLRDVKPTIIVAISIPLSVFFALVMMYLMKLSLNIMTLSGLALGIGMLVDNSIVVMENIFRLRLRGIPAPRAAVQGTRQVTGAIIASSLTTVCVFLPMIFTTGTIRELLVPMAISISLCLLASLIVAITVVPASASTVLKNLKPKPGRLYAKFLDRYEQSLCWCLKHKAAVLLSTGALLALCVLRLFTMGIVMIPDMTGDSVQVSITTPEGETRSESYAQADSIMGIIRSIDGVKDVGMMDSTSTAGFFSSFTGDKSVYGSYLCYVKPDDTSSGSVSALKKTIEEKTKNLDCTVKASTGSISDTEVLSSKGLTVNIYGNDPDTLESLGQKVMDAANAETGFENVTSDTMNTEKTLHLIIDKDKAMSCGLTTAQIYAQITARLKTSVTSTSITVDGENMDVLIEDTTNKLTKENLLDMELTSSGLASAASSSGASSAAALFSGSSSSASAAGILSSSSASDSSKTYKLSDFASLEETTAPGSVQEKNLTRYISVTADTKDGYNTTILSRRLQKSIDKINVPEGYSIELEGETSQVSNMLTQMGKLLALALLFIYLVMVAQFQSLLSPFIILFTIPLAFTGGMIGLILANEQLSALSLMGFLILMGTVVNNGIVFVDYVNQLRIGGMERRDALIATGRTRMRPILMTALTTILAMTQLIFGNGLGSEVGRGMAIVIACGLLYATFMTLYIVPVIYEIFFRKKPLVVDIGEDIDDAPDDAAEFIEEMKKSSD